MDKLLNIPEGAKLLRLSPNTLRAWIFQKRVPIVRLGRRVLFREADLEKMIQNGLQEVKESKKLKRN